MKRIALTIMLLSLVSFSKVYGAENGLKVYPVPGIFLSSKVQNDKLFLKAISSDGSGRDREYAIGLFKDAMQKSFPNLAPDINNSNKYSTLVAYLHVPRVSLYEINKSATLKDLYLPITMSINFANMMTGELVYSYSFTYYSKYETVQNSSSNDKVVTEHYRETFKDLLSKVINHAKDNFHPFTIQAKVKKTWNDVFVLDKGSKGGIVKGDILLDQYGSQLSVIHASSNYSTGDTLLGSPKGDSIFTKISNESIDEIKKPKVLLYDNIDNKYTKNISQDTIYQLFINALGKKASFSLISVDRSFFDVQKSVVEVTNLSQEVTQRRELPDYFLRLYFLGPFYVKLPSNKSYMSFDNYNVKVCGDILDQNGHVFYGKCVDETISDEVFANVRYANEAREEVLVKNAISKLADDFTHNIKFKQVALKISQANKNELALEDALGVIAPGGTVHVFHSIGSVDGIDGDVNIPTWEINALSREGANVVATPLIPINKKMPEVERGDTVPVSLISTRPVDGMRVIAICQKPIEGKELFLGDDILMITHFAIQNNLNIPYYDSSGVKEVIDNLNAGGYGFKKNIENHAIKDDYCIEPVYKIVKQQEKDEGVFKTYKYSLTAGLRVYSNNTVIWKKAMQQDITVSSPKSFENSFIPYELSNRISVLFGDLSKKIELIR